MKTPNACTSPICAGRSQSAAAAAHGADPDPGKERKEQGGSAKTMGILGRLGGLGARPEQLGFVSDGDGALTALAVAAKLLDMQKKGDFLEGDVFISTHVCPDAPTTPHEPVPFMNSPVETWQVNKEEVTDDLDAVLVVDTTKATGSSITAALPSPPL